MYRYYLFIFITIISFHTSCIFNDRDSSNDNETQSGSSEIFQQIQNLIKEGKLPNLDTGSDIKGEEIDGVRKDVLREIDRKFKEKYKDKPDLYKAFKLNAWDEQMVFYINPTDRVKAEHKAMLSEIAVKCAFESYYKYIIPYLEKKYSSKFPSLLNIKEAEDEYVEGLNELLKDLRYIEAITYNTYERAKFYEKYNETLAGTTSSDITDKLNQANIGACEFLERIRQELKNVDNDINKIDYYKLIEKILNERGVK